MEVSKISSLNCIKSNAARLVKQVRAGCAGPLSILLVLVWIFIFSLCPAQAEPPASLPSPNPVSSEIPTSLPSPLLPIKAQTYSIQILKRSNSNKVYLFNNPAPHQPKVGRLLLARRGKTPVMAFRLLKTYETEKMFAAKWVKRYNDIRVLEDSEYLLGVEKISDIDLTPPTPEDHADLKELEKMQGLNVLPTPTPSLLPSPTPSPSPEPQALPEFDPNAPPEVDAPDLEVKKFDHDLDQGISPSLKKNADENTSDDDENEQDEIAAMSIEDTLPIDHYLHWFTAGFGYVVNHAPPTTGGSFAFAAGNVRYGITLGRMLLLDRPHLQDSLTIEGGIYLYKALNYIKAGDAYTTLAISSTVRYNLFLSEGFGIFVYGGIIKNQVMSSSGGQDSGIAALTNILPAAGGGLMFQVGPSWYVRADLGLDTYGINLMLHF